MLACSLRMVWYDGATAFRSTFRRRSYAAHRKGGFPMGVEDTKTTKQPAKASTGFTDEEKSAMRNRAQELKAEARANKNKAEGESAALSAIAALPAPDRVLAERLHALITASAP